MKLETGTKVPCELLVFAARHRRMLEFLRRKPTVACINSYQGFSGRTPILAQAAQARSNYG